MRPVWFLAVTLACGGNETSPPDSGVDGTVDAIVDDGPASNCTVRDAGLNAAYSSTDAAAGCLPSWADYASAGPCPTDGLLCIYPEGQAACVDRGPQEGLLWSTMPVRQGCDELPPSQCAACSLTPGGTCTYLNGPDASVTFCCDGNLQAWDLVPEGGCPNGKTCGTIKASDYDQTCTTGADCQLVIQGDLCTLQCTNCQNTAINKAAYAQYLTDFGSKLSTPRVCPCAPQPPPACKAGVCSLGP